MNHNYSKVNFLLVISLTLGYFANAQNWQRLPVFPSSVASGYDLVTAIAVDDQNIYAISHLSEIAVSSDGGQNWTESTPANIGFGEFEALESNGSELFLYDRGFGFTPTPRIFKSSDNGQNWALDSVGYGGNILRPEFGFANGSWWLSYDRNKGYLPRAPYRYDASTNEWEEKPNAPEAQDICEANDSLFAINNQTQLIKSSDNGENWRVISSPFPNALMSALVSNNDTLFIISRDVLSQDCFFSYSADEGANWTTTDLTSYQIPGNLNRLVFYLLAVDGDNIIITSQDNNNQDSLVHLLISSDRGASFQPDSFQGHKPLFGLDEVYLKGSTAYILIDDRIYYNGSGTNPGMSIQAGYSIQFSAFPNPFQDEIRMSTVDRENPISLWDAQGRILIEQQPQVQNVLDVSHLKPGLYFIQQGLYKQQLIKH